MKPKNLKKMRLNKTTLATLNSVPLKNIKGGQIIMGEIIWPPTEFVTVNFLTCWDENTCVGDTCTCPESVPINTKCYQCEQ